MIEALRRKLAATPSTAWLRLLRLNVLARRGAHQDFESFIDVESDRWQAALTASRQGRRVLIATNMGGHFAISAIDRLLAVALTLRGAQATTVLCNGILPACQMCEFNLAPVKDFVRRGPPPSLCSYCYGPAEQRLRALRLPVAVLGDHVASQDIAEAMATTNGMAASEIRSAMWQGLPVGEHAYSGALRYFGRGSIEGEPLAEAVLRRYLAGAIATAIGYDRLFRSLEPDVVVAHHGIYTPQGVVIALARARGIRTVTWNPAYRRHCFIFSHDDSYHYTLMDEPTERWDRRPLDQDKTNLILSYLGSRRTGGEDWIRFHKDPEPATIAQLESLGLDMAKPFCAAFTNVFWDAQLHYPANAFADQREWLIETIRWFSARPDLQLVVRIHPAEVSGTPQSRQFAADEVRAAFPKLPDNVIVIPPDSAVSSYMLAERANAAIIYGTKMGVELAAIGIPVIVAGEAWARNKGFTLDADSKAHYLELLERLPFAGRVDEARQSRAIAYAYHFFFRRMIPVAFVQQGAGPRRFTVALDGLDGLLPRKDPGLDVICDGVLHGSPFEMDAADR